jgi:hypothetical protein
VIKIGLKLRMMPLIRHKNIISSRAFFVFAAEISLFRCCFCLSDGALLVKSHALHVEWSDKFVFNVFARSIFPCDMLPSASIGE